MYFLQAKRSITLEAELANVRLVQRTSSDAFDRVDIELDEDSSASSPEVLSCVLTASTFNLSEDCAGLAKKRPSSTSRTLKPAAHTPFLTRFPNFESAVFKRRPVMSEQYLTPEYPTLCSGCDCWFHGHIQRHLFVAIQTL